MVVCVDADEVDAVVTLATVLLEVLCVDKRVVVVASTVLSSETNVVVPIEETELLLESVWSSFSVQAVKEKISAKLNITANHFCIQITFHQLLPFRYQSNKSNNCSLF